MRTPLLNGMVWSLNPDFGYSCGTFKPKNEKLGTRDWRSGGSVPGLIVVPVQRRPCFLSLCMTLSRRPAAFSQSAEQPDEKKEKRKRGQQHHLQIPLRDRGRRGQYGCNYESYSEEDFWSFQFVITLIDNKNAQV